MREPGMTMDNELKAVKPLMEEDGVDGLQYSGRSGAVGAGIAGSPLSAYFRFDIVEADDRCPCEPPCFVIAGEQAFYGVCYSPHVGRKVQVFDERIEKDCDVVPC